MRWALACLLSLSPLQVAALEVRFHPADVIYVDSIEPQRNLFTAVLQNVAVVRKEGTPVTVESLEIQALSQGRPVLTVTVPASDLEKSVQRLSALEAQGVLKLYDFYFQTSRYLEGIRFSATRELAPGTALLVNGKPLLLLGLPEQIAVVARGRDATGQAVEARGTLRVENRQSANQYDFPLAGTWYVGAGPSLHSHHRWAANEEFALDLIATGGDGRFHKGDGSRLDDYYAFGKDILAVADGTVVETGADATEANDRLRRADESFEDFEMRTMLAQNALLAKSYKAPLGNYVVIRHAGGEFSHYGHLKQGSVQVKPGDPVKSGQVIGQVGHTGNSTEPHLHFQLTDGQDPMYSRGLPIRFRNVAVEALGYEGRSLQSGWIVTTKK